MFNVLGDKLELVFTLIDPTHEDHLLDDALIGRSLLFSYVNYYN